MIRKRNLARAFKKALLDPRYALGAAEKRFLSWISFLFGSGYAMPPETISLFLTHKCNLRCSMCGQWGEDGWARDLTPEELGTELGIDTIREFLANAKRSKPSITLFGGEPLLHSRWDEIVRLIKDTGLRVNMITNGTLLEKHVEKIVNLGLDEIIFSLDGPEEIHDNIRNSPGTFNRAVGAFMALDAYKKKTRHANPKVNVNTTIFESNYRNLDELVEIAGSIGADSINFHHLIFLSPGITCQNSDVFREEFGCAVNDWAGFSREDLPSIDPGYLYSKLQELRKHPSPPAVTVYPNFTQKETIEYYTNFNFVPRSYKPRCISPWMTSYIFPNGDVKPCLDISYSPGNIRLEQFSKIWNNDSYKKYRNVIKNRGCLPGCMRCTELYRA